MIADIHLIYNPLIGSQLSNYNYVYEQIRRSEKSLIGMHSFILWDSQFQSLRLYLNLYSMIHAYAYTDSKHPATLMPIESKYYTSDANGNQDSIPNIERRMCWDEDNRLMALSDNASWILTLTPLLMFTNGEALFMPKNERGVPLLL